MNHSQKKLRYLIKSHANFKSNKYVGLYLFTTSLLNLWAALGSYISAFLCEEKFTWKESWNPHYCKELPHTESFAMKSQLLAILWGVLVWLLFPLCKGDVLQTKIFEKDDVM